jgi:flagellar L-ring protein precursor FlgH
MKKLILIILPVIALLSACATPAPIVHQPVSMTAQTAKPMREVNGAIFQSASYRPMYEDNRARMVGDVLTINISEKHPLQNPVNSGSKTASTSMATPSLFGLGRRSLPVVR